MLLASFVLVQTCLMCLFLNLSIDNTNELQVSVGQIYVWKYYNFVHLFLDIVLCMVHLFP